MRFGERQGAVQKKGPAEVAASPSHGSTNPTKDTDMNEQQHTPAAAVGASVPDWYEIASEYEIALGNISKLTEVAEEIFSGDGREQSPGVFVMPISTFLQTHALLSAMRTVAKSAMEPAR